LSAGHAREGLEILQELHRDAPEDARYPCPLVQAYLALGRYGEAKGLLDRMLAGHEPRSWMYFFLGIVLLREKRFHDAFAALAYAEGFSPRTPALHNLITDIYLAQRRWNDAERTLHKAMAIDPDSAQAHLGMARLRLAQRSYPEAAESALAAIGLRYALPAAHATLGMALARMRDNERARTALRTALLLSPYMRYARRCLTVVERRA
jgi:predicted Zn-dependent protease